MPKSMLAPPELARPGPTRRKKKPKATKPPNAAGANGVAGGSHPPPARAQGGRDLGATTPSNGTTRRAKSKAGSSRASKPSPRRKASSAGVSTSSTPDLATLEAQIEEGHNRFVASFRTSLGHARRVGQLLLAAKEQLGHGKFTLWLDRPRRPFARATANGYMRIARHGAILDEDAKHQSAGDMTLAAALRRLSKPRVKGTADENSGTNTSTSSTRSTSGGRAGADDGGRSAAATTQTTADAANGAAGPDRAETAEARREAAHEDADRRRDDAGADGRRSEQADHRTRDEEDGSATREAEAAGAEDSSAPAGEDRLDDQEWLATLPVRAKLGLTAIFDEDALLWRHLRPGVDALTRLIEGRGRDVHEFMAAFGQTLRYPHRVAELLNVSHPRHWIACPRCSGRGRKKGQRKPCPWCDGAAYWTR